MPTVVLYLAHCIPYYIQYAAASMALKNPHHRLANLPPGPEMVTLLLALHPFWGEYDKDGVLEQEVADQNTAKFIVIPLFLLRPTFALGLV